MLLAQTPPSREARSREGVERESMCVGPIRKPFASGGGRARACGPEPRADLLPMKARVGTFA